MELNDSHTTFLPPDRLYRVEYGFTTMIIGIKCYIIDVKKGSDSEAKGLRAGDEVTAIGGINPTRDNYTTVNYIIYELDPQESVKLQVSGLDGKQRQLEITSKFISPEQRNNERKKRKDDERAKPYTCKELGPDLIACKLRTFEVEKEAIDKMMKEVGSHNKLILDLRGNRGGYIETEKYLAGYFFEGDVLIGTEKSRNKSKDEVAKGRKDGVFTGALAVLIDSDSASAAEVFARVVQLQKRGRVYGDVSAGAVMSAVVYAIRTPLFQSQSVRFGNLYYKSIMEVTVADLVMSDGGRLEGVGVPPDVPIGPSPLALSQRTDPVLSHVAAVLGVQISPESAGSLHFLLPKSEEQADNEADQNETK